MKKYSLLAIVIFDLAFVYSTPSNAQTFTLSEKTHNFSWPTHDWNGKHSFPPVYCLTFPRSHEAEGMTTATFNSNTISLARVFYPDRMSIYVVTSTIPIGRSAEDDVNKMLESNLMGAKNAPNNFYVNEMTTQFGKTIGLRIRNVEEGSSKSPFPLARQIFTSAPELRTVSVHRLFARGPDRMEVAVLKYFSSPVAAADEDKEIGELSSFLDGVVGSFQQCTSNLPIRSQR